MQKSILAIVVRLRRTPVVVLQLGLAALSNWAAILLRFDGAPPASVQAVFWKTLPILLVLRAATFVPFRLYEGLWRYTSLYDLEAILGGIFSSSALFLAYVVFRLPQLEYSRSVIVVDSMILTILLGGIRMTRRLYSGLLTFDRGVGSRVLIYGAGNAGQMIAREMKSDPGFGLRPVGFLDDDRSKLRHRIHGIRVMGTGEDLERIVGTTRATEVLIAMPSADPAIVRGIVRRLEPFKIPIKTLPHLRDVIGGKVGVRQIRKLALEDLLARPVVGLSRQPVRNLIRGRRVMITGAGGSIGSELARQIIRLDPESLVLFERYENSLHAIRLELDDTKSAAKTHAVIGDVGDAQVIRSTMRRFRPQIVFHAAAHKHVTLMEENPCESVKNNVRGTRVAVEAAEEAGVDRFIMISTDKAANPTSLMGCSKRLSEMIVLANASGSGTSFSIVRFGNVLGSNGSVVPRFLDQIDRGGPVTVTHPEVRRFFMLIPEAVQLVLHAAAHATAGATYVLDMGDQVKILDVARNLIMLAGLVPDEDVRIEFTGLRAGEKLSEELVASDEELIDSGMDKIHIVSGKTPNATWLKAAVSHLEALASAGDVVGTTQELRTLARWRPGQKTEADSSRLPVAAGAGMFAESRDPGAASLCPICQSALIRSRVKSLAGRLRKSLTTRRPFKCVACGWRGWTEPAGPVPASSVGTLEAVDLSALDEGSVPSASPAIKSFSPRDLT